MGSSLFKFFEVFQHTSGFLEVSLCIRVVWIQSKRLFPFLDRLVQILSKEMADPLPVVGFSLFLRLDFDLPRFG